MIRSMLKEINGVTGQSKGWPTYSVKGQMANMLGLPVV